MLILSTIAIVFINLTIIPSLTRLSVYFHCPISYYTTPYRTEFDSSIARERPIYVWLTKVAETDENLQPHASTVTNLLRRLITATYVNKTKHRASKSKLGFS